MLLEQVNHYQHINPKERVKKTKKKKVQTAAFPDVTSLM